MKKDLPLLPERYRRMVTFQGFRDLLWEEYQAAVKSDPGIHRSQIFNELNEEYNEVVGRYRYSDWGSYKALEGRDNLLRKKAKSDL